MQVGRTFEEGLYRTGRLTAPTRHPGGDRLTEGGLGHHGQ